MTEEDSEVVAYGEDLVQKISLFNDMAHEMRPILGLGDTELEECTRAERALSSAISRCQAAREMLAAAENAAAVARAALERALLDSREAMEKADTQIGTTLAAIDATPVVHPECQECRDYLHGIFPEIGATLCSGPVTAPAKA